MKNFFGYAALLVMLLFSTLTAGGTAAEGWVRDYNTRPEPTGSMTTLLFTLLTAALLVAVILMAVMASRELVALDAAYKAKEAAPAPADTEA